MQCDAHLSCSNPAPRGKALEFVRSVRPRRLTTAGGDPNAETNNDATVRDTAFTFHAGGGAVCILRPSVAVAAPDAGEATTPSATPAGQVRIAKGFKVELLYNVPKDDQGSWVSMCVDPKGRLIVSDQYGGLFRITPGQSSADTKVEPLDVKIGHAQGLLYAFDSLYVMVADDKPFTRGLYRVRDTNGDDKFDSVELAPQARRRRRARPARHPSHARRQIADVRVRQPDEDDRARRRRRCRRSGARTTCSRACPTAAGSWPACSGRAGASTRSTPTARTGSCFTAGFRNEYDAAFHRNGDLFTYDADMEWDFEHAVVPADARVPRRERRRVRLAQRRRQVPGLLRRQPPRRASTSAPVRRRA